MNLLILGDMDSRSHERKIIDIKITDEYLWEFLSPKDFLENLISPWYLYQFTHKGGCVYLNELEYDCNLYLHHITVTAWHPKSQYLDWLEWNIDWSVIKGETPLRG
jgi:hypothetical protein